MTARAALWIALLIPSTLCAQGILPPEKETKTDAPPKPAYLLIADTVPKSLTVKDADGKDRPLLSYKTANDILVVGFYSPRCAANQQVWAPLRRLYEKYKDWHVAFVGVSVVSDETLKELADAMTAAGLAYPAVRDDQQRAARKLHALVTPELVVIDEWGALRFRGSDLNEARKAIETVVSHIDSVTNPEPSPRSGCAIP